eukprot:CAMPEP_0182863876 /NCGR_PEP_ID=MMETSP0034_2-20130328/6884_1 /TAXON_ID=156128 /ORGANISM="Nephroselmis pyriformis, Strain CCMP717" /LENGTH=114 /DNA_ID=CAMNT_0024996119 /DNA_START=96 /DNA_END=437 /DNA_ORIENTATION=-
MDNSLKSPPALRSSFEVTVSDDVMKTWLMEDGALASNASPGRLKRGISRVFGNKAAVFPVAPCTSPGVSREMPMGSPRHSPPGASPTATLALESPPVVRMPVLPPRDPEGWGAG